MALQIPLNKFRRVGLPLTTQPQSLYTVPFDRAAILLVTLASNLTGVEQTVSVYISATKPELAANYTAEKMFLVKNAKIGGFDTANLTIGKVVLIDGDQIYASSSLGLSSVDMTLSILEAVNTD